MGESPPVLLKKSPPESPNEKKRKHVKPRHTEQLGGGGGLSGLADVGKKSYLIRVLFSYCGKTEILGFERKETFRT
jgi:hypothetical protein